MKYNYILVVLCLHVISNVNIHAQDTILYNKTTGIVGKLPFDDRFQIKLTGFEADSNKIMQLVFKEFPDDDKKEWSTIKDDNSYFKSLPEFMVINFDAAGRGTAYRQLKPNTDYLIELMVKSKYKIDKSKVLEKLTNDDTLKIRILKNIMESPDLTQVDTRSFDSIIKKRMAEIYSDRCYNIEIDSCCKFTKSAKRNFHDIITSLMNIGGNLKRLQDYLIDKEVSPEVIKKIKKLYYPFRMNGDDEDGNDNYGALITDYEDYKKEIQNISELLSEEIRNEGNDAIEEIVSSIDLNSVAINAWIGTVNVDIEYFTQDVSVYRSVANTNSDQGIKDGTTNQFGASISQTFGWGLSPKTSSGFLYVGYSLFFRPVNNKVRLRNIPLKERWRAMLGVNLGFTLSDMTTNNYGKASGIADFLGNKALMTGICFRPFQFIKIDFNSLIYALDDPNPTLNHKRLAWAPLIGISFSLNIVKIFNGQPNSFTTLKDQK